MADHAASAATAPTDAATAASVKPRLSECGALAGASGAGVEGSEVSGAGAIELVAAAMTLAGTSARTVTDSAALESRGRTVSA